MMELVLRNVNAVCAEDISQVLSMVLRDANEEAYVILARSEMTYMQSDGVTLEYQDGNLATHHWCPDQLEPGDIVRALSAYAAGDDWWRTAMRWNPGFTGDRGNDDLSDEWPQYL